MSLADRSPDMVILDLGRARLRQHQPAEPETLRFADLSVEPDGRQVRRSGRLIPTTPREFDLLLYLVSNPRQVLTRGQILDAVWGYDFGTSKNSVDVYVGYLRRKLEVDGMPRLLQTVYGIGYVLREE